MSLLTYAKYADSGIDWLGRLPAHWTTRRLKQLCEVLPSNVDKKTVDNETPVRLCNYTDVYYNETIRPNLPFMDATATDAQIERFTLRAGDTIITKDSETADDIARAAYVPMDMPGIVCGYHLAILRPFARRVAGAFVARLFAAAYVRAVAEVHSNGLTRVGLGVSELGGLELPVPPLEEQLAIVSFLDRETAKIDALVAEQQRLIELLNEKRRAVISHAVTTAPGKWRATKVKHVVTWFDQGWSPQCESLPAAGDDEWGVLKVGCVNGGVFRPDENKRLPPELPPAPELAVRCGDLLISRANTRELVGGAAVVDRDYPRLLLCDKLYRLRLAREALPAFVSLYLSSDRIRGLLELEATGASDSMLNITQAAVAELPIDLPPPAEQAVIVRAVEARVEALGSLGHQAQRAISLLQERRTALISAAVTGQIDVRPSAHACSTAALSFRGTECSASM